MWRLLLTFAFGLALLLGLSVGSAVSAQTPTPTPIPPCEFNGITYNYDITFENVPPPPGETGAIIRISGTSSDSCVPLYVRYEIVPGGITVYATETTCTEQVCQAVLTPWSLDVALGDIEPGAYSVQLRLLCRDESFQCSGAAVVFGATPTPSATPAPRVFTGRLGPFVQVNDACSYYPLTECDGTEVQISEFTPGQLTGLVGQTVEIRAEWRVCGSDFTGQPLNGWVAVSAQPIELTCPTPTPTPTGPTPTPAPMETFLGELGPFVQVADACSYYPLTLCDGTVIQMSERQPGLLQPWVGRYVIIEARQDICGYGFTGQPLYGWVAQTAQMPTLICPVQVTPTPGTPPVETPMTPPPTFTDSPTPGTPTPGEPPLPSATPSPIPTNTPVPPTATNTATATPSYTPTVTPTATHTATATLTPTVTRTPFVCDPRNPAHVCNGIVVVRAFIDFGCDTFFNRGIDWPLAGTAVQATLPDGTTRSAVVDSAGNAILTGINLPPDQSVLVEADTSPPTPPWVTQLGLGLAPCAGSPRVTLTRAQFGAFGVAYVDFRYNLAGR